VGNQQGNFGETDLAWLAGFIDGEGSFGFQASKGPSGGGRPFKRPYWQPRITLGNTDYPTLGYVIEICRAFNLPHFVWDRRNRGINLNGHQKADFWHVRAEGMKRCIRWLKVLLPYLRTKRDQAKVMHEFCEFRLAMPGHEKPYTARELEILDMFRNRRFEALTDYTVGEAIQASMV
jgi:hypothetical protein